MTFLADTTHSEPTRVAFQSFGDGPGIYIMSDGTTIQETDDEFAMRRGFTSISDDLMYMRSNQQPVRKPQYVLEHNCEELDGVFESTSSVEYYK